MFELAFITSGNPKLPALIFLHGFLGCKEDFLAWFPLFNDTYYCVAFDLPGHGQSKLTNSILLTIEQAILKIAQQKPACIAYSMGGRIALQLNHLFSSLALLSTHPGLASQQERIKRWEQDCIWIEKLKTFSFDLFLKEWYEQPCFASLKNNPSLFSEILLRRQNQNREALIQILFSLSLAKQPLFTLFPKRCSFFYGKEDWKYQQIYATFAPNVIVRGISNAGHVIHLENKDECARHIKEVFHVNCN